MSQEKLQIMGPDRFINEAGQTGQEEDTEVDVFQIQIFDLQKREK